jgi:hypothetical protein
MAESPVFPVLLQGVPLRGQRSLIPLETLDEAEDRESGDPQGWLADDGYRIIYCERSVFYASFSGESYEFRRTDEHVSDDELRELMRDNIKSLGRRDKYSNEAQNLEGDALFGFTFQHAVSLPLHSAAIQFAGCAFILTLCLMAALVPATIVLWLTGMFKR